MRIWNIAGFEKLAVAVVKKETKATGPMVRDAEASIMLALKKGQPIHRSWIKAVAVNQRRIWNAENREILAARKGR